MLPRSFEPVRHAYRFKAFPNFRTVTFIGSKHFRRLRYASLVTCFDRKHNPVFSDPFPPAYLSSGPVFVLPFIVRGDHGDRFGSLASRRAHGEQHLDRKCTVDGVLSGDPPMISDLFVTHV